MECFCVVNDGVGDVDEIDVVWCGGVGGEILCDLMCARRVRRLIASDGVETRRRRGEVECDGVYCIEWWY